MLFGATHFKKNKTKQNKRGLPGEWKSVDNLSNIIVPDLQKNMPNFDHWISDLRF